LKQIAKRLTYANVMSSIAVFLVLGGASALAASHLGKNSVGASQLKKNAVTAAKIKNGAITGSKINLSTLGAIPSATNATHAKTADNATNANHASTADTATNATNAVNAANSATTSVVKGATGKLSVGQSATILQYGPFAITAQCTEYEAGRIGEQFLISSSTPGSVFSSWEDGSSTLGPETPEEERQINEIGWAASTSTFEYEGPSDTNVSASAPTGQAFNAFIGEATEKDSNTCWYWLSANVIG
jgi:hypothetical protein